MRFASVAAAALIGLGLAVPANAAQVVTHSHHFQVGDGVNTTTQLVPDRIISNLGPAFIGDGVVTADAYPKWTVFGGSIVTGIRPPISTPLPVANIVPEPATWLLMILGFTGLALRQRARKTAAQA